MNQVISWIKAINLRQIITVFLVAMTFLVIPAFSHNPSMQAQANTRVDNADSYTVDRATVKRIQGKAEDLGDRPDRPIGDTGLKNIKNLGENIPETLEMRRDQGLLGGVRDEQDRYNAQDQNQGVFEGAKRAVQNALD
jgi:hypothetical protein